MGACTYEYMCLNGCVQCVCVLEFREKYVSSNKTPMEGKTRKTEDVCWRHLLCVSMTYILIHKQEVYYVCYIFMHMYIKASMIPPT